MKNNSYLKKHENLTEGRLAMGNFKLKWITCATHCSLSFTAHFNNLLITLEKNTLLTVHKK